MGLKCSRGGPDGAAEERETLANCRDGRGEWVTESSASAGMYRRDLALFKCRPIPGPSGRTGGRWGILQECHYPDTMH